MDFSLSESGADYPIALAGAGEASARVLRIVVNLYRQGKRFSRRRALPSSVTTSFPAVGSC